MTGMWLIAAAVGLAILALVGVGIARGRRASDAPPQARTSAALRFGPPLALVLLLAGAWVLTLQLGDADRELPTQSTASKPSEERPPAKRSASPPREYRTEVPPAPDDMAEKRDDLAPSAGESQPGPEDERAAGEQPMTTPEPDPSAPTSPSTSDPAGGAPAPTSPPGPAAPETTRGLPPPSPREQPKMAEPPRITPGDPVGGGGPQPQPDDGDGKWSVVPVFFGTDRSRLDGKPRLDYGAERGRRLDLGRALVSVPTAHIVPAVERPWELRIPYFDVKVYQEKEDPAKHFTVREIKAMTREELLALVAERLSASRTFKDHALIFVHGFNTSFDNAVYRTAQIANDLRFDGATFLYSWPSGGAVASYTYDRESAGQSEPFMRDFMRLVMQESKAKSVSVVAHSMGNLPVLQVLKDLKNSSPGLLLSQIILAAPDVDRDNFENIAREIKGFAKGITLYAAANDRALNVSRRFHGGVPRAGDVPASGPVVTEGVDTIDVTAVSTDSLGINHSGYAENSVLLNDISLLIQTGERPPDRRIPILTRIPTAHGEYWKYPGR
ncbi:MAG: alpha/beta hydrolase [Hyphomicrobium sp.]